MASLWHVSAVCSGSYLSDIRCFIGEVCEMVMERFMSDYTHTTHEMASFYIEEGMYTIKELEQMLAEFKQAKEIQDRHLKNALGIKDDLS